MNSAEQAAQLTLEEAIRERRSVRGFLDKPVAPEVLKKVFELAQWAPSNCNVQPWRVYVASGATRDRLRAEMTKRITSGIAPNPDYDYTSKFEGGYRKLQVDCAVGLYGAMGIGREDSAGRMRASLRNFELFDAPHVAFLAMASEFREPVALDVGIYLQTLMLAMTAHGISCCAQGSMRSYPDLVREVFEIEEEVRVLVGISFGYEDESVPANTARMTRSPLGENVFFKD